MTASARVDVPRRRRLGTNPSIETRVRLRDGAVGLSLGVVLLLGTVVLNAARTG